MRTLFFSMLMMLVLVFTAMSQVNAATIDLLPLFDTNGNGEIFFGDGFGGSISPDLDHNNISPVTRTFDLGAVPLAAGSFTVSVVSNSIDYNSYFSINTATFGPLGNGSNLFSGSNNDLSLTSNMITFNIGASGSNLDDFFITTLSLNYQEIDPGSGEQNPVPEPATMMLFGIGLLGLAGVGRKKI